MPGVPGTVPSEMGGSVKKTDLEKCTDEELIRRLRDPEEPAGEQIMDALMLRYKDLVRKQAKHLTILGGDTDDLIQEGMIGLFNAVRDYRPDKGAKFSTFAYNCIYRRLLTAIASASTDKNIPLNTYVSIWEGGKQGDDAFGELISESAGPEDQAVSSETVSEIEALIREELTEAEYRAFGLWITGLSAAEVADILGKPSKSTDNAIQRARKKLQKALVERGIRK